jgi:hypothetical protein
MVVSMKPWKKIQVESATEKPQQEQQEVKMIWEDEPSSQAYLRKAVRRKLVQR